MIQQVKSFAHEHFSFLINDVYHDLVIITYSVLRWTKNIPDIIENISWLKVLTRLKTRAT